MSNKYLDIALEKITKQEINAVLEQISDEVNKLKKVSNGNKVYVGINDVFDIIDKYKAESEE